MLRGHEDGMKAHQPTTMQTTTMLAERQNQMKLADILQSSLALEPRPRGVCGRL